VRRAPLLVAALVGFGASLLAAQSGKPEKAKQAKAAPAPAIDESLPVLGSQLSELPPGAGKATADNGCLKCHSADMLRQQRLNEKQWGASVTKMTGWGAEVPEDKRDELIAYLAKNFGPDNDRFQPVVTRPVGR
jgi:quinoprotein glucose dehydrogenase